jgi:mannose-6-phosphate isomerase class I
MEKIIVNSSITIKADNSFYGIYIISGNGKLITSNDEIPVLPNDQYFISTICDDFTIKAEDNAIELIRFWGQEI